MSFRTELGANNTTVEWFVSASVFVCLFLLASGLADYFMTDYFRPSFIIAVVVILALVSIWNHGRIKIDATAQWIIGWIILCLSMSTCAFGFSDFSESVFDIYKNRIYSSIFLLACYTCLKLSEHIEIFDQLVKIVLLTSIAGVAWEVLSPGKFSVVIGRAAGFFVNPTIAGMAIGGGLIACYDGFRDRFKMPIFLFSIAAVVFTFSRGSIIGLLIAFCMMIIYRLVNIRSAIIVLAAVLLFIFALTTYGHNWNLGAVFDNGINRIMMGIGDESAGTREHILKLAWTNIGAAPWFGYGLGAPHQMHSQGTHNMYLYGWLEMGVLGGLLFPLLLFPLLGGTRKARVFATYFLVMGFFSHNLFDERYFTVLLAYILARDSGSFRCVK